MAPDRLDAVHLIFFLVFSNRPKVKRRKKERKRKKETERERGGREGGRKKDRKRKRVCVCEIVKV